MWPRNCISILLEHLHPRNGSRSPQRPLAFHSCLPLLSNAFARMIPRSHNHESSGQCDWWQFAALCEQFGFGALGRTATATLMSSLNYGSVTLQVDHQLIMIGVRLYALVPCSGNHDLLVSDSCRFCSRRYLVCLWLRRLLGLGLGLSPHKLPYFSKFSHVGSHYSSQRCRDSVCQRLSCLNTDHTSRELGSFLLGRSMRQALRHLLFMACVVRRA